MKIVSKVLADWRAPMCAALIGSGVGLGLGATYMAAGMARHAEDHAEGLRLAEAAARGYAGSYLEGQGPGLRAGLQHYGLRAGADAGLVARLAGDRGADVARRKTDLQCLTEAVYYEARGEGVRGQAAVAQVVMNRVRHGGFPNTVCGVVFQGAGRRGCQFSFTCDGSMRRGREKAAWDRARGVAARVLAGAALVNIGSATHFHTAAVSPVWAPRMLRVATVGAHVFYRFAPNAGRVTVAAMQPTVQKAVLTAAPAGHVPDLRLTPSFERAVEMSLQPASPEPKAKAAPQAAPAPAPKAGEAAQLTPAALPAAAAQAQAPTQAG